MFYNEQRRRPSGTSTLRYFVGQTLIPEFLSLGFPGSTCTAICCRGDRPRPNRALRVLLLEIIVVSALYTSTTDAIHWYFVPIYPALAILIAVVIVEAIRSPLGLSFWAVWLSAILVGPAAPIKFFVLVVPCLALALAKREQTLACVSSGVRAVFGSLLEHMRCVLYIVVLWSRRRYWQGLPSGKMSLTEKELFVIPGNVCGGPAGIVAFYSDRTIQQASTVADLSRAAGWRSGLTDPVAQQ